MHCLTPVVGGASLHVLTLVAVARNRVRSGSHIHVALAHHLRSHMSKTKTNNSHVYERNCTKHQVLSRSSLIDPNK